MSTPADLALLALDPTSGRSRLGSNAGSILGGAALQDLLLAGRLAVEGEGRKARVIVVDPIPTGSPVLDPALARLAGRRPLKPADAVTRLGKRLPRAVHDDLVARGLLEDRSRTLLGVVPLRRYGVLPQAGRDELVDGVGDGAGADRAEERPGGDGRQLPGVADREQRGHRVELGEALLADALQVAHHAEQALHLQGAAGDVTPTEIAGRVDVPGKLDPEFIFFPYLSGICFIGEIDFFPHTFLGYPQHWLAE